MRTFFICAVLFGLLAVVPAPAQSNDHRNNKHDDGASNEAHTSNSVDTHRGMPAMKGEGHATMQQTSSGGHDAMTARSLGTHQNTPAVATTQNRFLPASGDTHPMRRTAVDTHRNWSGNAQASPTTRSATGRSRSNWFGNTAMRQPSVNSLRLNVQASHRFHGGNYLQPANYHSRHWGYGERLPHSYFVSNYWITDFTMFGLFAPPTDLIWVRVGDDALLIDRYSGDIVQVDYAVFY